MLFVSIKDIERHLKSQYIASDDVQSIIADFKIADDCLHIFRFSFITNKMADDMLKTIFGEAKENDELHFAKRSMKIRISQAHNDEPKIFNIINQKSPTSIGGGTFAGEIKTFKDAYYASYLDDDKDDERKFNKTIAFTSSFFEREKTIYLLNYVKDLNELGQKCFIIDADRQSPLLSNILGDWNDPNISFLDVCDLIYERNIDNNISLITNGADKYGMNYFLPFYKNINQLFDVGNSFLNLTQNHDFSFFDILKKIKIHLHCNYLIVNISCGMNRWAEPFLFDNNFYKISIEKNERCDQADNLLHYMLRYGQNSNNHFQFIRVNDLDFYESDDCLSSRSAYKKFFEVKA